MPLQQQNHEKLQVFHGDTKFKVSPQDSGRQIYTEKYNAHLIKREG